MKELKKYKICPRCEFQIPRGSTKCPKCGADLRSWMSKNKTSVFILIFIIIFGAVMINKYNLIEKKSAVGKVVSKKEKKLSNVDPRYRPFKPLPSKLAPSETITLNKFTLAQPGEKWLIQEDNISVMKIPEALTDKNMYINNLSTIIGIGDVVEITATKGLYWKRVNLYNNGQLYASGWILSDTVKKVKKFE